MDPPALTPHYKEVVLEGEQRGPESESTCNSSLYLLRNILVSQGHEVPDKIFQYVSSGEGLAVDSFFTVGS